MSAINTGGFGLGAIIGPIAASVLTDIWGYRIAFMIGGFFVLLLSFFHLASQFCYTRKHAKYSRVPAGEELLATNQN